MLLWTTLLLLFYAICRCFQLLYFSPNVLCFIYISIICFVFFLLSTFVVNIRQLFSVDSAAAAAEEDEENNTETELLSELLGPAGKYDLRARPQLRVVNVSIYHVLESILELVC